MVRRGFEPLFSNLISVSVSKPYETTYPSLLRQWRAVQIITPLSECNLLHNLYCQLSAYWPILLHIVAVKCLDAPFKVVLLQNLTYSLSTTPDLPIAVNEKTLKEKSKISVRFLYGSLIILAYSIFCGAWGSRTLVLTTDS